MAAPERFAESQICSCTAGTVHTWPLASFRGSAAIGRFSNRPVGVKRFQTIHGCSVDVSRGRALLFGIGTKALVWGFFSQEVYAERHIFFLRRILCPLKGRSFVPIAKPHLDGFEQDGAAWCGRDDDQRGARFRARFNRATTLYPVGPRTRTMMQSCASAAKLRSGGPILPFGV
jgi:hypothetical protein